MFVIGLIVLGPKRLPVAVKTVVGWIRALRSLATTVQNELTQELKLQEFQALDARSITYLIVVKVQVSRLLKEGEPCPLQCSSPCLTLCKPVKVQNCPSLSPCEEIQLPEEPCGFPVEGPPPYMMKPPPPQHIHHHSCCTHAPASVCTVCGRFIEIPPV